MMSLSGTPASRESVPTKVARESAFTTSMKSLVIMDVPMVAMRSMCSPSPWVRFPMHRVYRAGEGWVCDEVPEG